MSRARITFLFDKAMRMEITQEERLELFELIENEHLKKDVDDVFLQARLNFEHTETFFNNEESSRMIDKLIGVAKPKERERYRMNPLKWMVAALVLILFGSAIFLYYSHKSIMIQPRNYTENGVIRPARDRATLLLGNGKIIDLENIGNKVVKEGDVTITKTTSGQLVYQVGKGDPADEIKQNVLSTPRGGRFQVLLPDGTQVWLGPISSLRYPTRFEGAKREVTLTGEAYLEVAKNQKMPFIVRAGDAVVQVMGTNFLVSAYEDMNETMTTLFEGKVRVSAAYSTLETSPPQVLSPGQQASINKETKVISIRAVDTEDALAWKNGYFVFHGNNIQQVMKTIARWYDVDVTYQGDLSGETFIGTVSKFDQIEKLLQTIELTGGVHFKIEGRKIIVMK
ncbi:DUF4974 domain-containing protein [Olivibacter sp. CPCC 100613]|uniref:FecR family protein n=1 Tax=Olivibacter sp. CPCC 100613 TaxID=3079931 RepID=UPI002FF7A19F